MARIKNPLTVVQSTKKIKIMTGGNLFRNSTETSLPTELLNTSNVTAMNHMFYGCSNLANLDLSSFDTSNVTTMNRMFCGCSNLANLDLSSFDTSNVTDTDSMFYNCSKITSLDLSGFDMAGITNINNMFRSCSALTNFTAPTFYISVSFGDSPLLTHESLMSIINNLATVSTTQTLTLGSTNLAKLTTEEKAIATGKGWTLA